MQVARPPSWEWIAVAGQGRGCQNRRVLTIGLIALGVNDVRRAAEFWCEALGYELREDGFGGWAAVLVPAGGAAAIGHHSKRGGLQV